MLEHARTDSRSSPQQHKTATSVLAHNTRALQRAGKARLAELSAEHERAIHGGMSSLLRFTMDLQGKQAAQKAKGGMGRR